MSLLPLTFDELALLRFTCDLFFVEESPLYRVEAEKLEPKDYSASYHSLVEKDVINPHGFRITDDALNRIAPMTECDARVVAIHRGGARRLVQQDFYLLDEIAVQYTREGNTHILGVDLDPEEFIEFLARRFVPRRASGDSVDVTLAPIEYLAFAQLARTLPNDDGPAEIALQDLRGRLGPAPSRDAVPAVGMVPMLAVRAGGARVAAPKAGGLVGDSTWDEAIDGLLERGVLTRVADAALRIRPALVDMARTLRRAEEHTFIRTDFGEDEWFLRETTFLPTDGGLFCVGGADDGALRIRELDGDALKSALTTALGPARSAEDKPRPRYSDLLAISDDDEEDADQTRADPVLSTEVETRRSDRS